MNNGLTVGHNVPHKRINHTSVKVTVDTTLAFKCSVDEKIICSNYVRQRSGKSEYSRIYRLYEKVNDGRVRDSIFKENIVVFFCPCLIRND